MNSGERAKPPATGEERNPFDISRRSHTDVAVEIAKRMAAWKQARGRSYGAPVTATSSASAGEVAEKTPHLAAPVQPAGLPPFAKRSAPGSRAPQMEPSERPAAPRPPVSSPADGEARAPFFASVSIQRAMPPAPSLKRPTAKRAADPNPVASSDSDLPPAVEPETGKHHSPAGRAYARERDEPTPSPMPPRAPDASEAAPVGDQTLPEGNAAAADQAHAESRGAMADIGPAAPSEDADSIAIRRRAEAREIMARWMAARDAEERTDEPAPGDDKTALQPDAEEPKTEASRVISDASAGRARHEDAAPEPPAIAAAIPPVEALDELSGRREPTFDEPVAAPTSARPATMAQPAAESRDEHAAAEHDGPESPLTIEALEAVSGRREPTFDEPLKQRSAADVPPARATASRSPQAHTQRRIEVPAMQTRIEARRLNPLRADPDMALQRAALPHAEPEAWDVPLPIATSARSQRHKAGWAIGLGTVMLIIGLTAPAAILHQKGWEPATIDVAIDPTSQPQSQATSQATSQAKQPASDVPTQSAAARNTPTARDPAPDAPASGRPAQSAAARDASETPPAREASQDQAASPVGQPAAEGTQPQRAPQLGPVQNSGELNEAPVSAPPPPWKPVEAPMVNLASQQGAEAAPYGRSSSMAGSPMVARPFIPNGKPAPFLRPPTSGSATVPIDGAPQSRPATTSMAGASIGLKPSLIPQLKPKAARAVTAAPRRGTPQPGAKPFIEHDFEQMFEDLVNTLGQGKPPNPALRPEPGGRK